MFMFGIKNFEFIVRREALRHRVGRVVRVWRLYFAPFDVRLPIVGVCSHLINGQIDFSDVCWFRFQRILFWLGQQISGSFTSGRRKGQGI